MEKQAKKTKGKQFNGRAWFNNRVDERTRASLKEKHKAFEEEHSSDNDAQLLIYIQKCAKELNKSPNANEVIGGKFIAERFGGWNNAVLMAGLRKPQIAPEMTKRKIYKDEFKIQAKIFQAEREAQKKAKAENEMKKKQEYKQKKEEN